MKHTAFKTMMFAAGFCLPAFCEDIRLPPPEKDSGVTVMQALKARHSDREFSGSEIPMETLSGLLWAANGFNRPDKRTNATGMNKQTIVVYAIMKSGAYRLAGQSAQDRLMTAAC